MTNSQLLKQIKRIPMIVYFLLAVLTVLALYQSYQKVGHDVRVTASLNNAGGKTIAKVDVKDGKFVTGYDGDWKVKVTSFKMAVLMNIADSKEMFRFYDLLFVLVLNSFVFYVTYNLKEGSIISESGIISIHIIAYMVFLYPLFDFGYVLLARNTMEYLTHNQLTTSMPNLSYFKAMLCIFLAPLLPLMARRFRNLQLERNSIELL